MAPSTMGPGAGIVGRLVAVLTAVGLLGDVVPTAVRQPWVLAAPGLNARTACYNTGPGEDGSNTAFRNNAWPQARIIAGVDEPWYRLGPPPIVGAGGMPPAWQRAAAVRCPGGFSAGVLAGSRDLSVFLCRLNC